MNWWKRLFRSKVALETESIDLSSPLLKFTACYHRGNANLSLGRFSQAIQAYDAAMET